MGQIINQGDGGFGIGGTGGNSQPYYHRHETTTGWSSGGREGHEVIRFGVEGVNEAGGMIKDYPDFTGQQGFLHEFVVDGLGVNGRP